jgi:hypothetical protein
MIATAYERLIDALRDAGKTVLPRGDHRAQACCPAHDDHRPSLNITHIDGAVLIHCHAGCPTDDILTAIGWAKADLFDNHTGADYRYPGGRLVHRTPGKTFPQSGNKTDRSLFHADTLGDAALVYVTEGEKDVLAIEAAGGAAVCSAMGAGKADKFDWSPLAGLDVVIVADRDEPGRRHAGQVAGLLADIAASVRTVVAAAGKDAADHIAAGYGLDEFRPLPSTCDTLRHINGAVPDDDDEEDVRPRHVDVAAFFAGTAPTPPAPVLCRRTDGHALFYAGKVNLVFGDPESGKTLLVLAACAEALRDGRRVLYVDLDHNGAEFILPLLVSFGASTDILCDPGRFRYYDDIDAAASMRMLVGECALWRPAVAVIDSIGELLPMMGANSNDADDFTRAHTGILKPLAKTGAAVIEVDHLAKNLFSRSQGPTGAAAKRRPVGGLAVKVVCRRTFIPGKGGTAELLINKDRLGGVRRHSPPGRPQSAGTFVLEGPDGNDAISWRVIPPLELEDMPSTAARYLDAIREMTNDTFTVRDVATTMSSEEAVSKSQLEQARYNVEALDAAGMLSAEPARKGVATRYRLAETANDADDPNDENSGLPYEY